MRVCDLTTGAAQLREQMEILERAWSETRAKWDDGNSRSLESNQLRALHDQMTNGLTALQMLGDLLAHAERDCAGTDGAT